MKRYPFLCLGFAGLLFLALFPGLARAAIAVQQGITPAADWPVTADIETGDPGDDTTGVGVSATSVVSQTITPQSALTLEEIYFSYSTAAASAANSFSIRIQEVSGGGAAQTYAQGANLLASSTFTFSLSGTGGAVRLMKLSFTGADQILLAAGTTYAVEITSTGSAMNLCRRGADTYAGGAAYVNRSAINYPGTRDLAMAVVGSTEEIAVQEGIENDGAWPEPATVLTGTPDSDTTIGAAATATVVASQTFTPGRSFDLGAIYLAYSTTAASAADAFTLRIQAVPGGSAAQTYAQGADLLATPSFTFSLAGTGGAIKIVKFAFSGAARLSLAQGTTYAVEVVGSGSDKVNFYRRGADTYSGGSYYSNRSAFNYPSTRDLAMAVVQAGGAGASSGLIAGPSYLPVQQNLSVQMLDGNVPTDAEKALVAAAGFKSFRKGIYWSNVETTAGAYNFATHNYDTLINGLVGKGVLPYITLFSGNTLYGESGNKVVTAAGRAGFANFAAAAAAHYTQAKYFEVWNEPNNSFFWTSQPSISDYCALAAAAGTAIKAARPDALVVGPALAGQDIDFNWLEQAFQQGLLQNIDAVSVHPYRPASSPPETVLPQYAQLRALIQEYAPAGKRIDIVASEWGYHVDTTSSGGTAEDQADYAARMFLIHASIGMPFANWYEWIDGTSDPTSTDHYGLYDSSKAVRPAYAAIQTLAATLNGYTFQQRVDVGDPAVYVFQFANGAGKKAYAVWTTGDDADVQVPIAAAGGGQLQPISGSPEAVSWSAGGPTVTAGQAPQYLLVN